MRRDRHDVRRAIGKPDAGAAKRNLHHVLREVTGGMHHVLMCGGDTATRCVVVSAKMRGDTTSARRCQQQRQIDFTTSVNDRLRGFDHHFHLQRTCRQAGFFFEQVKKIRQRRDLFRNRDLGQA